jgi:alpha-2-macroglobulin
MITKQSISQVISAIVVLVMILSSVGCRGEKIPQETLTPIIPTSTGTPTNNGIRANPPYIPPPTKTVSPPPTVPSPTPTSTPTPRPASLIGPVNTKNFKPSDAIVVQFRQPMDPTSSKIPLLAFPYVSGVYSWNSDNTILSFKPAESLSSGNSYTFFLDTALVSKSGMHLDEYGQWQIMVDPGPVVRSYQPPAGKLKSRSLNVDLSFDRAMDRERVETSFSIQPTISHQIIWKNDQEISIQLLEPLQLNQRYDFLLAKGASTTGAVDTEHAGMREDYLWSYWVDPLQVDVTTTGPKTVQFTLNTPVDTGASGLPFKIQPEIAGTWTWKAMTIAIFNAEEPIPYGVKYSLTIEGDLKDGAGALPLPSKRYSFSAIPPIHEGTRLTNEEYGIPTDFSPLDVGFDILVDHTSAEAAFSINPPVDGTFKWAVQPNAGTETLQFYPAEDLTTSQTYVITLGPTVQDANGRKIIADPFSFSFQTEYYSNSYWYSATFGQEGTKVQVVDANGWRKIQFGSGEANCRFDLYQYDLNEFVKLYANKYGNRNDWDRSFLLPVPAEGQEPVAKWGFEYKAPTKKSNNDGENIDETVIPPEVKPGLYVLNLIQHGNVYDQLFVALTSNTIMTKKTADELFIWVSDINGASQRKTEIRLYSSRGEIVNEATTGEDGLLKLKIPGGYTPMLVSARVYGPDGSEDVSIAGLDNRWNTVTSQIWGQSSNQNTYGKYIEYIYTDRPIYRPGQAVNFKVIVRRDQDVRYSLLPTGTPVTINVKDARGNVIQTTKLFTNEFGSVNSTYQLGEDITTGSYSLEAVVNDEVHIQAFKVEAYRKPEFQVSVMPVESNSADKYFIGQTVKLHISAKYFFGEPVAGANFDVGIFEMSHCYYCYSENEENGWFETDTIDSTPVRGKLNPDGSFDLTITPRKSQYWNSYSRDWRSSADSSTLAIEVKVHNGGNEPVKGTYIFSVYSAEELISLDNGGYVQRPSEPFTIQANVVDLEGRPVEGRKLILTIHSWDNQDYSFKGKFAQYPFVSDAYGHATQSLNLPAGFYKLSLTGTDPHGNEMTMDSWVYVVNLRDEWFVRTEVKIRITPDKAEYKPYETATFLIESEFSGPAEITFERGSIIHSMPIVLTAPLTTIQTEIIPEFAPNVYVTVNAWQPSPATSTGPYDSDYYGSNRPDSHLRMAQAQIQVVDPSKILNVNITTDQETYAPGQAMEATIQVSDSNGKPVRAEVSLAVIDEAIYSLSAELAPDMMTAFYSPRRNTVSTYDSMSPDRIIWVGGRGSGGGSYTSPGLRNNFQDAGAWFPALYTDAAGEVKAGLTLPDNLTSWRLTAKAITISSRVGEAKTNVVTKKDLIVQPVLPRLFTNGDQVRLAAVVQNFGQQTRTMQVSIETSGLAILGETTYAVTLNVGGMTTLTWEANVTGNLEAGITFRAVADDNQTDDVYVSLPIQPSASANVNTSAGEFSGSLDLVIAKPSEIIPETSHVILMLNSDASGSILSGLDYLIGYPYGCVEQTMSKALPNAVVSRAGAYLNLDPSMKPKLNELIQKSLNKLYSLQHSDGGWGWWWDDSSDDYQTAWVLFGLSMISQAGYDVSQTVMDEGVAYIESRLGDMDVRTHAYALYSLALAGKGNLEDARTFKADYLNDLDPFSQASLALALKQNGDVQSASDVMDAIAVHAIHNGPLVYWPQDSYDGEYHSKTMASTLRTTALVLDAYIAIEPHSDLIPGMEKYLLDSRQGLSGWGTTNETSYAILALTDYLMMKRESHGDVPVTIELNGKVISEGLLDKKTTSISVPLPLDQLHYGANSLSITSNSSSTIYYNISTQYDVPGRSMDAQGGVQLNRYYLDATTNESLGTIKAGQLVKVKLTVKLYSPAEYMIIQDRLPAGLEAVNDHLSALPPVKFSYGYDYDSVYSWEELGYNYKDIHDDRVDFFVTHMKSGFSTFFYLARASFSGEFIALPAEAFAMYDTTVWGRSASTIIEIK